MIFKEYLAAFSKQISVEAETIGLFKHNATNGMLKEFLVHNVLEKVLPKSCSVVSGIIFDEANSISKQMDLIIVDNRCFGINLSGGIGYYPVESVIATIEVKSKLNKKSIDEALTNSLSTLQMNQHLAGPALLYFGSEVKEIDGTESQNQMSMSVSQMRQASFIFSFDSITMDTCMNWVNEWFISNGKPQSVFLPLLPKVIMGKGFVGMLKSDGFSYTNMPIQSMGFLQVKNELEYLISHLLYKISRRIRMELPMSNSFFTTAQYLNEPDDDQLNSMRILDLT